MTTQRPYLIVSPVGSSRKGIQRPTTQRRVADTRAAHARAS